MNLAHHIEVSAGGPGSGRHKEGINEKDFPSGFKHTDGRMYWKSDKYGHNAKTGEPSAEYRHTAPGLDRRLWRSKSGVVSND